MPVVPLRAPSAAPQAVLRVLVVDDNREVLNVLRLLLTRLGHAADTCADPREAVGLLRHGDYGLLITDVAMPELAGDALIRLLCELQGGKRTIPAVAMTGYAEVVLPDCVPLLHKPFREAHLVEAIRLAVRPCAEKCRLAAPENLSTYVNLG